MPLHSPPISSLHYEILAGGTLSKGYINDRTKTEQVFVRMPHLTGDDRLVYRTGDLGKYNADGELVVSGRIDFQFKIRNQRIEAAEVENVILSYSPTEITNCVVMKAEHNEEEYVVAYLAVGTHLNQIDIGALREYCQTHLFAFSVPSLFMQLASFPVLHSGKINRHAVSEHFVYIESTSPCFPP